MNRGKEELEKLFFTFLKHSVVLKSICQVKEILKHQNDTRKDTTHEQFMEN